MKEKKLKKDEILSTWNSKYPLEDISKCEEFYCKNQIVSILKNEYNSNKPSSWIVGYKLFVEGGQNDIISNLGFYHLDCFKK